MSNVFDILMERGYIKQTTNESKLRKLLEENQITFYIGFDPTADSLHIGHFLPIMAMSYFQKFGHKPIALIGGGTAMVGDPTGKTEMRKMLSKEDILHNAECIKKQMSNLIDFSNGKAIMVNNGDWLLELNYVNFLRDIGKHFTVNRMLTAECFKQRWGKGLTFIEFNYMLMQAYDFLELYRKYNCILQLGGDDQWSNILAGIDLIRRVEGKEAYGLTLTLLTTSEGKKMGKTEKGALWLDPKKTSPYEFYQYWRNVDDNDVENCLKLLTFLPLDEIKKLCLYKDERINEAKRVLAYEVTKIIHGEEEAKRCENAARALFNKNGNLEDVPSIEISKNEISVGIGLVDLLVRTNLVSSKSEARRVIQQGGASINDKIIKDINYILDTKDIDTDFFLLKKGKKSFCKVVVK